MRGKIREVAGGGGKRRLGLKTMENITRASDGSFILHVQHNRRFLRLVSPQFCRLSLSSAAVLSLSQRRKNPPQASHTSSAPKTNLTCTQLEQMARERKGGRGEEGGSEKKAAGGRLCAV